VQEFYIRKSEDADARGPFSMEQLSSLAETGQLDLQTTYYDVDKEEWLQIGANDSLRTSLFPEKRKLKMKPKEVIQTINQDPALAGKKDKPITVVDMLDAAEGLTDDAHVGLTKLAQTRTRGAELALQLGALLLILHAFAMAVAEQSILLGPDLKLIFTRPLAYAAVADLVLGFILFLGATEAYPVVRIRAAAMMGFLTITLMPFGDPNLILAACLSAAASYALTHFVKLTWVLVSAGIGIGATAWLAWLFWAG
jgi:hypothetical protein